MEGSKQIYDFLSGQVRCCVVLSGASTLLCSAMLFFFCFFPFLCWSPFHAFALRFANFAGAQVCSSAFRITMSMLGSADMLVFVLPAFCSLPFS
jgi:hypothetical protein